MKKSRVHNPKYLEKYFTQFPNIIDDSDLTPYEYRLLLHYYRVGETWEGVRKTSEICSMSIGKVSQCRKTLEQKGFIRVEEKGEGVTIHLVDLSQKNLSKYSKIPSGPWSYSKFLKCLELGVSSPVCIYCGAKNIASLDHLIPVSRGGKDDNFNLASSCNICNKGKGDMTHLEFIESLILRNWLIDDCSPHEHLKLEGVHDMKRVFIGSDEKRSSGEHKKNHSKNNPLRTTNLFESLDSNAELNIKNKGKKGVEFYSEFVELWCDQYPILGFDKVSGAKIKELIKKTVNYLKVGGKPIDSEHVVGMFAYVLNYLKTTNHWCHGKDINTFETKYLSIVNEIKNGKSGTAKKTNTRDIIDSL